MPLYTACTSLGSLQAKHRRSFKHIKIIQNPSHEMITPTSSLGIERPPGITSSSSALQKLLKKSKNSNTKDESCILDRSTFRAQALQLESLQHNRNATQSTSIPSSWFVLLVFHAPLGLHRKGLCVHPGDPDRQRNHRKRSFEGESFAEMFQLFFPHNMALCSNSFKIVSYS